MYEVCQVGQPCIWSDIIIPLLTPLAIIGIGIWVNITIRRKNRKELLVVSYLQEIQKEINSLINSAIHTKNSTKRYSDLRRLSNELLHLAETHDQLVGRGTKTTKDEIVKILLPVYLRLKRELTEDANFTEKSSQKASFIGNLIRRETFGVISSICDLQR